MKKKMIINKINFKQFIWFIGKKNDEKKKIYAYMYFFFFFVFTSGWNKINKIGVYFDVF